MGHWKAAIGEAPCLIGGRQVNSSVPELYLIFIHMNAAGRDRLPQTNWNSWDQAGPQRGKQTKGDGKWGGVCICDYEYLKEYKAVRMNWYGWKDTNPYGILISVLSAYALIYYLVSRMKLHLIPDDAAFLLTDIAEGRIGLHSKKTRGLPVQSVLKKAFSPLVYLSTT